MKYIKKLLDEMILKEEVNQSWDKYGDIREYPIYYNELKMEWTPVKEFAVEGYVFNKLKPLIKELYEK